MSIMSLFAELKRRNVFRVAAAYLVLAWLILQVGDTLAPALRLPDWVNPVLAFFLILGFPLAVFFAWAFEMTPDGLKLEKHVDRERSITPVTGRKLDRTIIVLLALALVYFIYESRIGDAPDSADSPPVAAAAVSQPSIAVLPFVNMSSDAEQEYFSDGLSEELLNLLAKIPELKVTSRSSAFSFKGKDFKISEVGRELDVDHVLEGSVRKSGSKVRITAQLIRVHDDSHLWSETWDRSLEDVFVIQDEIAAAVVSELKVRLLGSVPRAVDGDPAAFSLYLQARHLSNQRTVESLTRAETLIDEAIAIDPDYTPAWVLKAHIHSVQGDSGHTPSDVAFPKARRAVEHALELDPDYGRAHALLADVLSSHYNDWAGARREIERALALDPRDVDTLYQACVHYGLTRAHDLAIAYCEDAIERDPLFAPLYPTIGVIYQFKDDPETAYQWTSRLLDVAPGANGANYYAALGLISLGRIDEAVECLEDETLDGFKQTGLAIAWHAAGDTGKSDAAMQALQAQVTGGWYYQVAMARAYRGEVDAALTALEDAVTYHDVGATLLLDDPYLDNIRDDPRFDAVIARLGILID
ncbi:MAG TPA: hypothetical protein VIS31_10500 [Woeseiaceae bacterium]